MESIEVSLNWKLPFGQGQFDRLEIGGSWGIRGEQLNKEDIRQLKKEALRDFLVDLKESLEGDAQKVIDKLCNDKIDALRKEYETKLEQAREAVLSQK